MVASTQMRSATRPSSVRGQQPGGAQHDINVGDTERIVSALSGGALAFIGLRHGSLPGLALAAIGGSLLYRGLTGHCSLYQALGVNTDESHSPYASMSAGSGVKVTKSIYVNRPADELYEIWRDLEGLPRFMRHLESVRSEGQRSRWTAKAPGGLKVSWDAEIINGERGRLLAWRSLEGSQVSTAGSVHFQETPGGNTEVQITLKYDPPGGKLGSWLAWVFGQDPARQIAEDLQSFKQLAESRAVTSSSGV